MSRFTRAFVMVLLAAMFLSVAGAVAQAQDVDTPSGIRVSDNGFVENVGQWDDAAKYRLESQDLSVWLTESGFVFQSLDLSPVAGGSGDPVGPVTSDQPVGPIGDETVQGHTVAVNFGSQGTSTLQGAQFETDGEMPGVFNWIVGDIRAKGAKAYQTVIHRDAFPGIHAHFTSVARDTQTADDTADLAALDPAVMKTTWEVDPGVQPSQIVLEYVGADALDINGLKQLVVKTSVGDIIELPPVAWQPTDRGVEFVTVNYQLEGNKVSFNVGVYDDTRPLFIDPVVIFSARFLGGTSSDYLAEMHEDGSGRYYTGWTFSSNFPTTTGAFDTSYSGVECFAAKTSLDSQTQMWTTYVGSTSSDYGGQSALAGDGSLFLGCSTLNDFTWPKNYVYGPTGGYDHGIFHLSADGSSMVAGAVLGGTSTDYLGDIELDAAGNVVVTGASASSNFPQVAGFLNAKAGGYDAMIYRLSTNLATYMDFTFVPGGTSSDVAGGLAFDAAGNVYAYGNNSSSTYAGTVLIGPGGGYDAWVAKYNPGLDSQFYNAEIGGTSTDGFPGFSYTSCSHYNVCNSGIIVDSSNRAWVTAYTASANWPTTPGAFSTTNSGNYDVFVIAMNAGGTGLEYSTMIGGSSTDGGRAVKFDGDGNVYIAGSAASSNYPTTDGEVQESSAGSYDFVRTIFTPDVSALQCSTYWGGSSTDYAADLERDPTPFRARVAGSSASTSFPDEPAGNATFGPGGGYDIAMVDLNCGGATLGVENFETSSIPRTHSLECITAGDLVVYTFDVVNTGLSGQPNNLGPEFEGRLTGPQVIQSCDATDGLCILVGNGVEWNGAIPSGGTVSFRIVSAVAGGVPAFTQLCLQGQVNFDPGTGVNEITEEFELCTETNCPPTVYPNIQLGQQVHLPILNFQGQDDVCRTWLEVQNIGPQFNKAVLVTWGEPGFCPPQCAGPLKVECSGLLKPGSTWNFLGAQVPTGSKSGMLFQFSAAQLSEIGLDGLLGFDDVVADLMCETLFFGVVGDCDDYRRFKKAYNEGSDFAGIPMNDDVKGLGILAVDVLRHCPGDVTPGVEVSSKYNGIAGTHLGAFDPVFGGYAFYVPLLYADKAGFNSVMYIQNGGLECSSVEIWFKAQDDCLRARICEIFTLAPGESFQFDATDCVGPDWQGSAWLRTTQPMAIAIDIIGRDVLMTYVGVPAQLNYTFDPNQAVFRPANQVAYGPLMYSEYQGWDSGVQVQNFSSVTAAKVKVYFLDRSGDIITTLVDWICPRGSQTFFLPVVHNLPGNWVGSIRVESQEWWTPGDPLVFPPDIGGAVTLIKYNDAARTEATEAIAYNLLPEHKAYDWQLGFGGGGLDSGIGLIAIPSLLKDLDATGVTSEIAIANIVPKPGFTDFAIFIYDQNGLLDLVCEKLNEKQVEYVDLQTWGFINPGFKGSAFISAVFWEHDVFDGSGFFLRNLVGLAAVVVERTGTSLGEDVPGDEAAGARGIPFAQSAIEDMEFEFDFEGYPAICPGLPDFRFGEGPGGEPQFVCPPPTIDGTMGTTQNWIDTDTWTQGSRIFRDGVTSQCAPPKACPGGGFGGGGNVDAYYFDNPDGLETCVTITSGAGSCWGGFQVHASGHTGRYPNGQAWACDPDPDVTYLGDYGGSPGAAGQPFGFTIPSGVDTWTLLVTNNFGATNCTYEFEISGFACQ